MMRLSLECKNRVESFIMIVDEKMIVDKQDGLISRFRAQEDLFSPIPNRANMLSLPMFATCAHYRIMIIRNHAIEPMLGQINQYANFGGWAADFQMSAYDDSIALESAEDIKNAHAALFWINPQRYDFSPQERAQWLAQRCEAYRRYSHAPIVVATWTQDEKYNAVLGDALRAVPEVFYADMKASVAEAATSLLDSRLSTTAGTPLSRSAMAVLAREIGCRWLPAVLFEPLKAVALDLDNTLHSGVLGEDGIDQVRLTPAQDNLQKFILSLEQKGILLALVSRNEEKDVRALFNKRRDYPLRFENFSATAISWGDKANGIRSIAEQLRISPDAVLMVDDNVGELFSIHTQLPQTKLLWAHENAEQTQCALAYYPRLWRFVYGREDTVRGLDLAMNVERESAWKEATNEDNYFRQLQIRLTFAVNVRCHLPRLAQLANKTNQFNTALARMNAVQLVSMMDDTSADVVAVGLDDRLCDSGIIALVAATHSDNQLHIKEICISCRALGRKLEDAIILGAMCRMTNWQLSDKIIVNYSRAPRNNPALSWLQSQTGDALPDGDGKVTLDKSHIDAHAPNSNITIIEEHE